MIRIAILITVLFLNPMRGIGFNSAWANGTTCDALLHDPFISTLLENPLGVRRALRSANSTDSSGKESFAFLATPLRGIVRDVARRTLEDSVLRLPQFESTLNELLAIQVAAEEMLREGSPPRKEATALIWRWIETMDKVIRQADPTLTQTYQRQTTKDVIPRMNSSESLGFSVFSEEEVSERDLLWFRPMMLRFIGILKIPQFKFTKHTYRDGPLLDRKSFTRMTDGYELDMEEFSKHDAEHAAVAERLDRWLLSLSGLSEEEIVKRWTANKAAIEVELEAMKRDSDIKTRRLYDLVFLYEWEIIHERGYQYDLPTLLQQLTTAKWTNVIRKKFEKNFWGDERSAQDYDLSRLAEARLHFKAIIERLLVASNLVQIVNPIDQDMNVRVISWPEIVVGRGQPAKILGGLEFGNKVVAEVQTREQGVKRYPRVFELSLAQIRSENPEIDHFLFDQLEIISLMAARGDTILTTARGPDGEFKVVGFEIDSESGVWVRVSDGRRFSLQNGVIVPLGLSTDPEIENHRISPILREKINRTLSLIQSKRETDYTITQDPTIYTGKVVRVNASTGTIDLMTSEGNTVTFNLNQVSIEVPAESEKK